MVKLLVRDDMSESVRYTSLNLPILSSIGRLSEYLSYTNECHWHKDLEFIVVLEGEMSYYVNGTCFPLCKGDGILVNSNRLHFASSSRRGQLECVFICLLLNPSLLSANPYIESRFVNPLLYDNRYDTLFFPAETDSPSDWRREASARIIELAELTRESPDDSALKIQSRFYELWELLFTNTVSSSKSSYKNIPKENTALKRMISFIQQHYNEKISLDEIAAAGCVCRNKCCSIFKQNLHQSVFEYLLNFRIRRSLGLLTNEDMSITEVALSSGFSASSYYGEIFKRITGISPYEYRRKIRNGDAAALPGL